MIARLYLDRFLISNRKPKILVFETYYIFCLESLYGFFTKFILNERH